MFVALTVRKQTQVRRCQHLTSVVSIYRINLKPKQFNSECHYSQRAGQQYKTSHGIKKTLLVALPECKSHRAQQDLTIYLIWSGLRLQWGPAEGFVTGQLADNGCIMFYLLFTVVPLKPALGSYDKE